MALQLARGILLLWIALTLFPKEVIAATRQMECREWLDEKYQGMYAISYDVSLRDLSISFGPERTENSLFGRTVVKWSLLWEKELSAVFYGADPDDWTGPVKILSLDFGDVTMFAYSMGSPIEASTLISKIAQVSPSGLTAARRLV